MPEDGPKYSRAELRALLTLHGPTESLEAEKVEAGRRGVNRCVCVRVCVCFFLCVFCAFVFAVLGWVETSNKKDTTHFGGRPDFNAHLCKLFA